jgi:nucleoside-diphosphate-sugar epimerase
MYKEMYGPAKLGGTFCIYLDNRRAREGLDREPTVSLSDGLAKTVTYFHEREIQT